MSRPSIQTAYKSLLQRGRLSPNPNQAALVARLASLQSSLLTGDKPHPGSRGLYIYGAVGTGKSRLADLFASTLPASVTSRRIHFHAFMLDIHARLHRLRSQPFGASSFSGDLLEEIGRQVRAENRVLCFDEFQVTDVADAVLLKGLFAAFWSRQGVVVATSNRAPERLYENGLNRQQLFVPFVEALRRECEVWRLEGKEDYRISASKEERQEAFFTDHMLFDLSLRETVGDTRMQEKAIPVMMGRQLKVLATVEDGRGAMVVKTTFEDLCQNPLGSADYHALCALTSKIYLTGLRQFRADELDYVRRFITLVDLAYETKTRIICLSTVPLVDVFANVLPRQIDLEGQLKDAFNMTVRGEGGSSSSMMSTFIGEMEWSATGLREASLATGGAGETDVGFAVGRAVSRLYEMGSRHYGAQD
ncbi:hypothetical protein QTJ16_005726 [Diplocarpon rosae]|uniref:AFG1-like ATPase n=1 Tax=Diplocarpon rosae TaxID=946125 RepID=A0AAD9SYH6_9HELO|nr:hypothetical protein QTJ16_005726 [Diplocarpon rosae]